MKEFILVFVAVLTLAIGVRFFNLKSNQFFAPQERKLENAIYKESEQYNEGMLRELSDLKIEYIKASEDQKLALKSVILHKFSVYPEDRMPQDLLNFYQQLKGE